MQELSDRQPRLLDRIALRFVSLGEKPRIALLVLSLFVLLGATYFLTYLVFSDETDISLLAREVDAIVISHLLTQNDMNPPEIRKNFIVKQDGTHVWEQIEITFAVDESQSMTGLSNSLKDALDLPNMTIQEDTRNDGAEFNEILLSVLFGDLPIYQVCMLQEKPSLIVEEIPPEEIPQDHYPPAEIQKEAPAESQEEVPIERGDYVQLALIVDDVGYDLRNAMELLDLKQPMTISILPQLKYSQHIAELAHDMGYEVMLHLPMESGKRLRRNPGFITSLMSEEELIWVIDRDLKSVPHVAGVNNHQGSLMTCDAEAMARVMNYLATKGFFFIDSRTTSESIAYDVAKEYGLRAAKNDLFLDNIKDVDYIKGQIAEVVQEARQKGFAVGICHVHPATIKALREVLPTMQENGVELVFASELTQ
jgi:polysaccharide deacetylase 2 family uncharacterized protein YibQ